MSSCKGFYYEKDEFFPPLQDGDDLQLPQRRNIQQKQQWWLNYSSGKEDDFHFNYQAND